MYKKWMPRNRPFCHSPLESQVHANGLSAAVHVQFFKNAIREGMDGRRRVSSERGDLLVGKAQDQVGHYFAFRRGQSPIYGRQEASVRQASDQDFLDFSREGFPSSLGITQDLLQRFLFARHNEVTIGARQKGAYKNWQLNFLRKHDKREFLQHIF